MITILTKEKTLNNTSLLQLSTNNTTEEIRDTKPTVDTTATTNTTPSSQPISKSSRSSQSISKSSRDNSLYNVFLTAILHLLHFLYITYIAYKTLRTHLYNKLINSDQNIHQRIQYDISKLTKIPNHLSINISRELSSFRTIENWEEIMYSISFATCWAWEFGIKEVSVYDQSGKVFQCVLYRGKKIH
jgi:hypothetical protein